MTNVVAFTPRPRPPEPAALPAMDLRTHLEGAAQTALDAADQIIAALDRIDGAVPPLAAAIVSHAETVGGDGFRDHYARSHAHAREDGPAPEPSPTAVPASDPEPETPTVALETAAEPETPAEPIRLPWRGAGNVVSAAGCAILTLVGAA